MLLRGGRGEGKCRFPRAGKGGEGERGRGVVSWVLVRGEKGREGGGGGRLLGVNEGER